MGYVIQKAITVGSLNIYVNSEMDVFTSLERLQPAGLSEIIDICE